MLDVEWAKELATWIPANVAEINNQVHVVKTTDEIPLLRRRINLFIKALKQKKSEITIHIRGIRIEYAERKPIKGVKIYGIEAGGQTLRDINSQLNIQIAPWKKLQAELDKEVLEMERFLYEIEKLVSEQTKKT